MAINVGVIGTGNIGTERCWDGYAATATAEAGVASLTGGGQTTVDLTERPALYEEAP